MVPRRRVDLVYGVVGGELLLAVTLGSLWAAGHGQPGLIAAAGPQAGLLAAGLLLEWRHARRPGAGVARPAVLAALAVALLALHLGPGTVTATAVALGLAALVLADTRAGILRPRLLRVAPPALPAASRAAVLPPGR